MVRDELSDPRNQVLCLLESYASTSDDVASSREAIATTIRFVHAYPDCAYRELLIGHLTGSAWIVNPALTRVLLTHHRKLGKWLQLGGHADGDLDLAAVAMREAEEESGRKNLKLLDPAIFDLDIHLIPARGVEPEHWHYDLRFLIGADDTEAFTISSESKDLAWIDLDQVSEMNGEESIQRMVRKTRDLRLVRAKEDAGRNPAD